jgi:Zn-dependent protease
MQPLDVIQQVSVWALPVLFAITVHEVAHGWAAKQLGDRTAQMLGRLTLNPLRHIDPIGTVLVPLLLLVLPGGFIFGWAKPVPVTWQNLNQPKRDMALVAVAGPLANLLMVLFWILMIRVGVLLGPEIGYSRLFFIYTGVAGIFINTILMVLNLIPLPPLDGGRVLTGLLPGPLAWKFSRVEPYGFIILVALLATGLLGKILGEPLQFLLGGFGALAGLSARELSIVLYALGFG